MTETFKRYHVLVVLICGCSTHLPVLHKQRFLCRTFYRLAPCWASCCLIVSVSKHIYARVYVYFVREMRSSWQGWAERPGRPLLRALSLQWLGSFFTFKDGAEGLQWDQLTLPNPAPFTWHVYGSAGGWWGWGGASRWGRFISQHDRQTHILCTWA